MRFHAAMPPLSRQPRRTKMALLALVVALHLILLSVVLYLEQRPGPPPPPLLVNVKIIPAHTTRPK